MKIIDVTIDNLHQAVPLFDQYRVFYSQKSNPAACHHFLCALIQHHKNNMWMAVDDNGQSIGIVNLYPSFTSIGLAPIYILNDLFVSIEYRSAGIATALLSHVSAWAKKNGALRLHLETGKDNLPAQGLYEKLGWIKVEDAFFYFLPLCE